MVSLAAASALRMHSGRQYLLCISDKQLQPIHSLAPHCCIWLVPQCFLLQEMSLVAFAHAGSTDVWMI